MKNWIIAIALVSAASAQADGIMPKKFVSMTDVIRCQTKTADGFSVVVSTGGFVPHEEASLNRHFRNGDSETLNGYFIDFKKADGKLTFTDALTAGREFNLVLTAEPSLEQSVEGTLVADSQSGRVAETVDCSIVDINFKRTSIFERR